MNIFFKRLTINVERLVNNTLRSTLIAHRSSFIAFLLLPLAASAQIPDGYYDSLRGKKGAQLKNAIHELIKKANVLDYGSGSGHTWDGFYRTDRLEDNQCIDRYSNDVRYFSSTTSAPSGMNIEHSFPKSWWGGTSNQAYKDLYNLMPSEQKINSSKSNYPMGVVTSVKTTNGCTKVGTGSNGYQLWEPADKWKGDFARGYMYMATAYQHFSWQGTQALQLLKQGDYPTLQKWAYTLYIQWARTDKVDQLEARRNNAVSEIQGNRNPYVDFPNLMEYVWGDSVDYEFYPEKTLTTGQYSGDESPVVPEENITETLYSATFTSETGNCTITTAQAPAGSFDIWTRSSKYGWTGTAYANKSNHAADASLVTPEIDLSGHHDATLSFYHAVNYCSNPSAKLKVEVICNGETTILDGITWPKGSNWTFVESGDISLEAFTGKKIRIAFHYTSTDSEAATWEIKTISLKATRNTSGITAPQHSPANFNPQLPYRSYTIDGRKATRLHRGITIIRQKGKSYKVMEK